MTEFFDQLRTGDNLRDYQHASRTFVDGLYRLAPKVSTLFHVFIDINESVANTGLASSNRLLGQLIPNENIIELGLMAKTVSLPRFTVQTKVHNAYNRRDIAQEKINYDATRIAFHDDSANVVRDFWARYFAYYYRDSDHQDSVYAAPHKYQPRTATNWGFGPQAAAGAGTPRYLNSIRIYSLHQKQFSAYILINPTITEFTHGEHQAGQYDPMEHTMTVEYEAIQYEYGPVDQNTVRGWNVIHYDNTPSPLSPLGGGTASITGPGGAFDTIGTVATNLRDGNIVGAVLSGTRGIEALRDADLRTIAGIEFEQAAKDILRGQNTQARVFVPTFSSVFPGRARGGN